MCLWSIVIDRLTAENCPATVGKFFGHSAAKKLINIIMFLAANHHAWVSREKRRQNLPMVIQRRSNLSPLSFWLLDWVRNLGYKHAFLVVIDLNAGKVSKLSVSSTDWHAFWCTWSTNLCKREKNYQQKSPSDRKILDWSIDITIFRQNA